MWHLPEKICCVNKIRKPEFSASSDFDQLQSRTEDSVRLGWCREVKRMKYTWKLEKTNFSFSRHSYICLQQDTLRTNSRIKYEKKEETFTEKMMRYPDGPFFVTFLSTCSNS